MKPKTKQAGFKQDRPVGLFSALSFAGRHAGCEERWETNQLQRAALSRDEVRRFIASAMREAEVPAWMKALPSRFLPALAEEKRSRARARATKQDEVRRQSSRFRKESAGISDPLLPAETDADAGRPLNR